MWLERRSAGRCFAAFAASCFAALSFHRFNLNLFVSLLSSKDSDPSTSGFIRYDFKESFLTINTFSQTCFVSFELYLLFTGAKKETGGVREEVMRKEESPVSRSKGTRKDGRTEEEGQEDGGIQRGRRSHRGAQVTPTRPSQLLMATDVSSTLDTSPV